MRKTRFHLALIFTFFCFNSFTQYIPFCQKGKWGFANTDGKVLVPCIYQEAKFFSLDSLALVKKDGKYGYINDKNIAVIPFEFEACHRIYEVFFGEYLTEINTNPDIHLEQNRSVNDFKNNRYIASKNQKFGVYKMELKKPKLIIPHLYSNIQFDLYKKLFHCTLNKQIHYFDLDGKELSKNQAEYFEVNDIVEVVEMDDRMSDKLSFQISDPDGKVGYVKNSRYKNTKYDTIVPVIYDDIIFEGNISGIQVSPDIFAVKLNNKWGFVDDKRNLLLPIQYDTIDFNLSKKYKYRLNYKSQFVVCENDKWGLIGKKDKLDISLFTLIPLEYQKISKMYFSYFLLSKDSKFQIYDIDNNKMINDKTYNSISKYKNESVKGFYLFETKNSLGQTVYIGENGVEFFMD